MRASKTSDRLKTLGGASQVTAITAGFIKMASWPLPCSDPQVAIVHGVLDRRDQSMYMLASHSEWTRH
ncbi:MAG TPA: hypothetical protein EYN06_04140 [Myxococcales bacterium]|nr:hypothetical protein [Myxococcales bacterium]HIN85651.1 hypothetical protein [Myxococcales bacterium]